MFTSFEPFASRRARRSISMGAVLLLATACGSDSPTGSDCNNLTNLEIVGLLDILYSGQSLQVSAEMDPISCDSDVAWSASPGITIDQNGVIEGDQVGGPFTITAMAGGLTATGEISVASGPPVADARWALAWTNFPAADTYTVSNGYNFSTGGDITSTRTGPGAYTVTFAGLAATGGQKQNVQVSAYYTSVPTRCRVVSLTNQGSDLAVSIRCDDLTGTPTNSRFDIVVIPAGSLQGRSAFVVSTSAQGGPVPAASAHNSALEPIFVERTGTGIYRVTFGGLTRNFVGGGPDHVQLTAYGEGTTWCKVSSWTSDDSDLAVNVRCFTPSGSPADAAFSALVAERGRAGKRFGFVWGDLATSDPLYTPNAGYNHSSADVQNTAYRFSTGEYIVNWPGLGQVPVTSTAETNLVTAYGQDATYCQVDGWSLASTTVLCFAPDGTPANSQFTAMWIE